jgi:hypothetical protein
MIITFDSQAILQITFDMQAKNENKFHFASNNQ